MPEPITAAAIVGGASLLGQGANAFSQGATNRKARQWNEQMYERQKQDSLNFWNMQNDYNNPSSQMARLREAGLNPNLVYGNGAVANSADAPRTPTPQSWSPDAPKFDLSTVAGQTMNTYFDVQGRKLNIDNLKADNTIKLEQAALLKAQTLSTLLGTKRSEFDFGLDQQYSAEARNYSNKKMWNEIQKLGNDSVKSMLEGKFLQSSMQSRLDALGLDNKFKKNLTDLQEFDKQLRSLGINPSDPTYVRIFSQLFGEYLTPDAIKNSWIHKNTPKWLKSDR